MSAFRFLPVALGVLISSGASSQTLTYSEIFRSSGLAGTPVNAPLTYVNVAVTDERNNSTGTSIRLDQLIGAIQGPTTASLVAISSRLDHIANRFREGIALAGAVNVLPPNPGDRFAISFGGAGYDGAGAGSVAISARINESTLAYVGYARGPTQNLVKGGLGFSFR